MKENSTPNSPLAETRRRPAPRRQTVAFLRQFARAYTVAPALPAALASMVPN